MKDAKKDLLQLHYIKVHTNRGAIAEYHHTAATFVQPMAYKTRL